MNELLPTVIWSMPLLEGNSFEYQPLYLDWSIATTEEREQLLRILERRKSRSAATPRAKEWSWGFSNMHRPPHIDFLPFRHLFNSIEPDMTDVRRVESFTSFPMHVETADGTVLQHEIYLPPTKVKKGVSPTQNDINNLSRLFQLARLLRLVEGSWGEYQMYFNAATGTRESHIPHPLLVLGVFSLVRQIRNPKKSRTADRLLRKCVDIYENLTDDVERIARIKQLEQSVYEFLEKDPGHLLRMPIDIPLLKVLDDFDYHLGVIHSDNAESSLVVSASKVHGAENLFSCLLFGISSISQVLNRFADIIEIDIQDWKQNFGAPVPTVHGFFDLVSMLKRD